MSGYILQGKKADGSMVNIDLAAKYDALGEEISVKYATKSELGDAGNFDENGSYPNLTAGTATEATHAASADTATNSTYAQTASTADTAGYATTAKGDEDGNDIKNTYATKSELDAVDENASRFIENGSYPDLVAGTSNFALQADQAAYASSTASAEFAEAAFHADSADSATKATQDGQGRDIASTYALKGEGGKLYKHTISFGSRSNETNDSGSVNGVLFLPFDTPFTSNDFDRVLELLKFTAFSIQTGNPNTAERLYSGVFVGGEWSSSTIFSIETICPSYDKHDYISFLQDNTKKLTDVVTEV